MFEYVLIDENFIELEDIGRDDQPCWCPDAYVECGFRVTYCPTHGSFPDPDLWDYSTDRFPVVLSARQWFECFANSEGPALHALLELADLAGYETQIRSSVAALCASVGLDWTDGSEVVKEWVAAGDVVELEPDHPAPIYVFPGYYDFRELKCVELSPTAG